MKSILKKLVGLLLMMNLWKIIIILVNLGKRNETKIKGYK